LRADKLKKLVVAIAAIFISAGLLQNPFHLSGAGSAFAQQRDGPPNLLDLLFGGGLLKQRQRTQQRERPPPARRVIVNRSSAPASPKRQPPPPPKASVEKNEEARKILVMGDFLADGLHSGLQQAYAENPDVVFVSRTSGLSGLVRDDVLDWPGKAAEFVTEVDPVAVIVLVGMNDRQEFRSLADRPAKLSEAWRKEYEARIEAVISSARDRQLPLIWIGLPPVRSNNMSSDYLVFNEMFRTRTLAAGGSFVDVWDGFTNADGAYIAAGPDVKGQIVRLRNSDGINMTQAGKRKLAFYAEREIRKITGIGSDPETSALPGIDSAIMASRPDYDPAASGRTIVLSLDDPAADGSAMLEGAEGFLKDEEAKNSISFNLVTKGVAMAPHEGRIDYDWGLPAEVEESEQIVTIGAGIGHPGTADPSDAQPSRQ
jgi:uncharacterized protein